MWVDDMLILTPKGRRDLAERFWSGFRKRFNCKDLIVPWPEDLGGVVT